MCRAECFSRDAGGVRYESELVTLDTFGQQPAPFLVSIGNVHATQARVSGYVAVTIHAGPQSYVENVPVWSDQQRADVLNRVTFLQSLIGRERHRLAR